MDPNEQLPNKLPNATSEIEIEHGQGNEADASVPPVYTKNNNGDFVVKQSLIERLLSPQSLQWMMMVGGGMLVIGFVVWLWSIGVFENPMVVAVTMGGGIAALIAAGISTVKFTRYRLAGNGLTLLGAMAMPLQLWFYHAQGLINLGDGGHLWIPAAGFCLIYALIARVLRNPAFVYTLVGGVMLTGMLFLADQNVNQFWNLLPQVSFLVGLGWICVFAEKQFVESESDFSRDKFGSAFRLSGITAIVGGLSLLMASQITGVFYNEIAFNGNIFPQYVPSLIQQFWALAIIGATAIGVCVEGGFTSFSRSRKISLLGLVAWLLVCLIGIINVTITFSGIATAIAAAIIVSNLYGLLVRSTDADTKGDLSQLKNTAAFFLCLSALGQALLQSTFLGGGWIISHISYVSLAQVALASIAAVSCALLNKTRITKINLEGELITQAANSTSALAVLGGVTATAAVWTAASFVGFPTLTMLAIAIAGLILPIALIALGLVFPEHIGHVAKRTASAMTASHIILLLQSFMQHSAMDGQDRLLWVGVSLVAAGIHYLCSYLERRESLEVRIGFNRFASYGFFIAAISILLSMLGLDMSLAIVSGPTILGLIMIVVGRSAASSASTDTDEKTAVARVAQWELVADYGRIFVMFANTAAMLWALNMLVTSSSSFALTVAIGIQLVAAMLANVLSKTEGWKHGFISSAVVLAVTECLVLNDAIPFTTGQKSSSVPFWWE